MAILFKKNRDMRNQIKKRSYIWGTWILLAALLIGMCGAIFGQHIFLSAPSWTSSGDDQADAYFGNSVATAGDVNGDGYSDVIVGAAYFDTATNMDAGKAYVFYGSSSGFSSTPNWISSGDDQADAYFGNSVATAGDVNGDGYSDVIVGAPYFGVGKQQNAGKTYVYYGSSSGLSTTANWDSVGDNQGNAHFGHSVATAGDINKDGYADVIIGARGFNSASHLDAGKAYVYYGSSSGLSSIPAWTSVGDDRQDVNFGTSVATAGDVNGDGYSDVIVGAEDFNTTNTEVGKAYVYYGSSSGLSATDNWTSSGDDQVNAYFGHSVATAGDVNGDGYADVLVGASHFDSTSHLNAGKTYVYYGSSSGLSTTPSWTSVGDDQADAYFGLSVSTAGDVNGDGYSDVIVGAKAYVYYGSSSGLSSMTDWDSVGDGQVDAYFGASVSTAGDVNGDGYSDVIVGAKGFDTNATSNEGKAYLYYGSPLYPPKNVKLRVRDKAIDVTWEHNPDNPYPVDKYRIYYDISSGWPYTYSLEVDSLYNWAELTDLTNTDTYFVSMTAVVSGVESNLFYEKVVNPAPADTTVTRTITGGTTSSAYTMISTPVEPEDTSISAVFEDDLGPYDNTQWRAFHWEPEDEVYEEITSTTNIGGHEERESVVGYSGWLISRNDVTIDVTGCLYDHNNTRDYEIYLQPGWNQIGCPFNFRVAWADVEVTAEGYSDVYSANDSTNPLCGDIAWGWCDGAYCEVTNLVPTYGCFVYNKISELVTLIVPHTEVELSGEDYTTSQLKTDYNIKRVPSYKEWEPWKSPPSPPATLSSSEETSDTSGGGGGDGGGGCFIATAAFGTPMAEEVRNLCEFRDRVLLKKPLGKEFVKLYYIASPPVADFIRNKPILKAIVRINLEPLIWFSRLITR